jgi:hypothetical protein
MGSSVVLVLGRLISFLSFFCLYPLITICCLEEESLVSKLWEGSGVFGIGAAWKGLVMCFVIPGRSVLLFVIFVLTCFFRENVLFGAFKRGREYSFLFFQLFSWNEIIASRGWRLSLYAGVCKYY